jgi:hypothetical protein
MEARSSFDHDEDQIPIDAVVARIKARGITPLPKPSPEAVARFLAHTEHEMPMSADDLAEHERMWQAVDAEVRALDPSSGIVPGRQ